MGKVEARMWRTMGEIEEKEKKREESVLSPSPHSNNPKHGNQQLSPSER